MTLQTPTSTTNVVGISLGSNGPTPCSYESVTLKTTKGKEDDVGPVISTPDADDYPDGGLVAWSVVFGVSPLTVPPSSEFTD